MNPVRHQAVLALILDFCEILVELVLAVVHERSFDLAKRAGGRTVSRQGATSFGPREEQVAQEREGNKAILPLKRPPLAPVQAKMLAQVAVAGLDRPPEGVELEDLLGGPVERVRHEHAELAAAGDLLEWVAAVPVVRGLERRVVVDEHEALLADLGDVGVTHRHAVRLHLPRLPVPHVDGRELRGGDRSVEISEGLALPLARAIPAALGAGDVGLAEVLEPPRVLLCHEVRVQDDLVRGVGHLEGLRQQRPADGVLLLKLGFLGPEGELFLPAVKRKIHGLLGPRVVEVDG